MLCVVRASSRIDTFGFVLTLSGDMALSVSSVSIGVVGFTD